jgi:hypothetical protein
MKGLESLPGAAKLERAYRNLQIRRVPKCSVTSLALYAQWARFDPRLAEIWVAYLARHWRDVSPLALREVLKRQPWPMAAGVLLEFVERAVAIDRDELRLFSHWKALVLDSFPRAHWEQFFIGERRVAGKAMLDDARFSSLEYKKWGYLGREVLFNKQCFEDGRERIPRRGRAGGGTHRIDPESRLEILRELFRKQESVTTEMYWNAIGRCVSRRQAERDLQSARWLKASGRTRARVFRRVDRAS